MHDQMKDLLARNDALATYVLHFNLHLSEQLHPQQFSRHFPELSPQLEGSRVLDRHLQRDLGLEFHFDFRDPTWRLALLPHALLDNLIYLAGILSSTRSICAAISRDAVMRIRERIGEQHYAFALKRAPFLLGNAPIPTLPEEVEPASGARQRGTLLLWHALQDAPNTLIARLCLKLCPQSPGPETAPRDGDPQGWARRLTRLVTMEAPQWSPLFA